MDTTARWEPVALEGDLRAAVEGEVRFDDQTATAYATDASNFAQVPIGVVIPASVDDVLAIHEVCVAHGAPILPRGAGTSISGGAVNHAVVIDFTRLRTIGPVEARRVLAQPGAINARVDDLAGAQGLRFGPDPSSNALCTIGGNVGSNACGIHSLQARLEGGGARTSDNVASLDVLTYDGHRMRVGPTTPAEIDAIVEAGGRRGQIYRDLRSLRDRYAELIRERFPRIPRRVSGYNLDDLLPERGFNVARALAGTEGTCVSVLGATLDLILRPPAVSLLVLGYEDPIRVADHVAEILDARPAACEMFDRSLLGGGNPAPTPLLPSGNAWIFVELGARSESEASAKAAQLVMTLTHGPGSPDGVRRIDAPGDQQAVWAIRRAGMAMSRHRAPGPEPDHHAGWEDSAVAPQDVGTYLTDLRALYDTFGYDGAFYGHLGDGCIHSNINFDLSSAGGRARYREFLGEAADLVVSFGGSLSGEHGDGHQRAELLPKMFGGELVGAFREFKAIWDPTGGMNPHKVVDPYPLDSHLKVAEGTGAAPARW